MPAASARSSTAWAVASSEPTLCMNAFSSASPNVMPPRQRFETLPPAAPRIRYIMRALGAVCTGQKGGVWWAAHHRVQHKLSDAPGDLHSVVQSGCWWAHMGWILARDLEGTDGSRVKDLAKYPELC